MARLSAREAQVLCDLCINGGTDAAIGQRLGISPRTVRTYMQHLRTKLGAHSKVEMIVMFWKENGTVTGSV